MSLNHRHHFLVIENGAKEAALVDRAFGALPGCGTVSIARNVSEAKAYLCGAGIYSDRSKFPLPSPILSDYDVDDGSGLELLRWVKADTTLEKIPFVLLAPPSVAAAVQSDRRFGVRIVAKPTNAKELKETLDRLAR